MHWLLKSEPSSWSWEDQVREKITKWDGVRNYQARNNMKAMEIDDLCFLYHSAIKEPKIMGIVKVIGLYEPEINEPNFGYVSVECVEPLENPVTLKQIKTDLELTHIPLLRQSRLSVMPLTSKEWHRILSLSQK